MPRRVALDAAGQWWRTASAPPTTVLPPNRVIVVTQRPSRSRLRENMRVVCSTPVDEGTVGSGGGGAVVFDAVGPSSAGASAQSASTLSWSHTCTGSNRLVVVGVATGNAPATGITTSATYGGSAMTSVGTIGSNNGTDGYVTLFRLIAPATGASTVVVTTSSSVSAITAGSVSFTGVHQTTPLGTVATAFGFNITPSVAVTGTATGNLVVDAVCTGAGVTNSSQTSRWLRNTNIATAAGNGAQSTAGTGAGGTVTMGYTVTSDWWGIVAVEVKQA